VLLTLRVDSSGSVSFAGVSYRVGRADRRRQVQFAIVGDVVEISSAPSYSAPRRVTIALASTERSPTSAAGRTASTRPETPGWL